MNTQIQNLKTEIKQSAAATRLARIEARKLSGMDKWRAQVDAEDDSQRERLLAYGYLRGRTYHQIEQKCRMAPSARLIAEFSDQPKAVIEAWVESGNTRRAWPEEEAIAEAVA